MKKLIAIAVALAACLFMAGCGPDDSGAKATVEKYYSSLNNGDLQGMIDCCDNATATTLNGSMDLLSLLLSSPGSTDVDVRSFVMQLYPSIGAAAGAQGVSYELKPTKIDIDFSNDTHATANVNVKISVTANGDTQEADQAETFAMVKEGDTWKIDLSSYLADAFGSAFDIAGGLFGL